jgi:hypothetical protein
MRPILEVEGVEAVGVVPENGTEIHRKFVLTLGEAWPICALWSTRPTLSIAFVLREFASSNRSSVIDGPASRKPFIDACVRPRNT